jgi:hypothetical protein
LEKGMTEKICYCFNYTDEDIVRDVRMHGKSLILEKIAAAKKEGGCRCSTENPKGR